MKNETVNIKPFSRLRGAIEKAGYTRQQFADAMQMSYNSLSLRLCGYTEWTLSDVYDACKVLRISPVAIPIYFPRDGIDKAV